METEAHQILKYKALEFLYIYLGCRHVVLEMKVGSYIFDAIGCDGSRVYIIEAKQDIDDFKRDCNDPDDIREAISSYKELIRETGEIKKYKKLINDERKKSIKFFDESLLKLSSARFIIAPEGLLEVDDVPENWGLVSEYFQILKDNKRNSIDPKYAYKIIRDISVKQTKFYLEQQGVEFGKTIRFPGRNLHNV